MDLCIICVESTEDISSRITTLCSEWIECKMQRVIEKHLWWWYVRPLSNNTGPVQWICRQCWREISSFHQFYNKVQKAHKYYQLYLKAVIPNNEEISEINSVKYESDKSAVFPKIDIQDRRRRRRPRNSKNIPNLSNTLNIKEEEILSKCTNNEHRLNEDNKALNIPDQTSKEDSEITTIKDESDKSAVQCLNVCNKEIDALTVDIKKEEFLSECSTIDEHSLDEFDTLYIQDNEEDDGNCFEIENVVENHSLHQYQLEKVNLQENVQPKTIARGAKKNQKKTPKTKQNSSYKKVRNDNFFKEIQHQLECSICNISLIDFRSLKEHFRDEHNTKGYAICCDKKYFKRVLLIDHLRVHSDPTFFKCESCTKTFATRRGLELHVEIHKKRERKFNCDTCGKSYFKLHVFERHKLTHVPEIEKHFKCSQCDKKFASDCIRRQHEDSAHAKKYSKICHICGKSYTQNHAFLRHMDEHAGTIPSYETCDICGVKLTDKYGLKQHMKWRHLEENLREQICPYCSRVSPNINAHRKHIKYTHTMQRKHACHFCDKAFRRPLELKEHLCTHTGEALYTCPHCPRTFISNANMHKHRKIVHRKEWEESRLNKFNKSKVENVSISANVGNDIATVKQCVQNAMTTTAETVIN